MAKKLVAYSKKNGRCDKFLKVANLDETQIAVLKNEVSESEQEQQQVLSSILNRLAKIELELSYMRGDIDKETYESEVGKYE